MHGSQRRGRGHSATRRAQDSPPRSSASRPCVPEATNTCAATLGTPGKGCTASSSSLRERLSKWGSCRGVVVFVEQSAESVAALDLSVARSRVVVCCVWREQREARVNLRSRSWIGNRARSNRPGKLKLCACWVTQHRSGWWCSLPDGRDDSQSSMKKSTQKRGARSSRR